MQAAEVNLISSIFTLLGTLGLTSEGGVGFSRFILGRGEDLSSSIDTGLQRFDPNMMERVAFAPGFQ